jgi:hypothetical protein
VTSTSKVASKATQCEATTKRGARCRAWTMDGSRFCFVHDPATVKERAEARAAGGRARHGRNVGATGDGDPVTIETMGDVVELLTDAVNDLLRLENSIARARAVATLANSLIKALEFAELAERVEALERILKEKGEKQCIALLTSYESTMAT